ncbi:hypothetical protein BC835DRAFT_307647 [Cytidiella melzeri]|nr:hypothetical protein BC835DRAFT_307647 [Cytidiella melzeri]
MGGRNRLVSGGGLLIRKYKITLVSVLTLSLLQKRLSNPLQSSIMSTARTQAPQGHGLTVAERMYNGQIIRGRRVYFDLNDRHSTRRRPWPSNVMFKSEGQAGLSFESQYSIHSTYRSEQPWSLEDGDGIPFPEGGCFALKLYNPASVGSCSTDSHGSCYTHWKYVI